MEIEKEIDRLYLSAHQHHVFTIDELLVLLDTIIDLKKLRSLIITDKRFVHLVDRSDNKEHFIVDSILFKWFFDLNLTLYKAGIFKISDHQFASKFSTLRSVGRWHSIPTEVINWGHSLGLVCPFWEKREFVFPLAHVLYSMKKNTFDITCKLFNEFCDIKIWTSKLSDRDVVFFIEEGFSKFDKQIVNIIKSREALYKGNKETLQKLGDHYGVTRERIRQLEERFWDKLQRDKYKIPFIKALLIDFFKSKGSLVIDRNTSTTPMRLFLTKCLEIPTLKLSNIGLTVLTFNKNDINYFKSKIKFPNNVNLTTIEKQFESKENFPLSKKDIKFLSKKTYEFMLKKLTLVQKVYIALHAIGKPSHFTKISDAFNSMWPEKTTTEHSIHNALAKQKSGIVWIGIKGTYALKEWGYEKPSMPLFNTISEIVKKKYRELSSPVPYTVILAELGKYRKIVKPASIAIATQCNPDLIKVGKNSFIPKDESQDVYREQSLDELDKIFKAFKKNEKINQKFIK
jgi:hypothetical protein